MILGFFSKIVFSVSKLVLTQIFFKNNKVLSDDITQYVANNGGNSSQINKISGNKGPVNIKQNTYNYNQKDERNVAEEISKAFSSVSGWQRGEDEQHRLYFYNSSFGDVRLIEQDIEKNKTFYEPWTIAFPAQSSKVIFNIRYKRDHWGEVVGVYVDGASYLIAQPDQCVIYEADGGVWFAFYYIEGSPTYYVNEIFRSCYPIMSPRHHMTLEFPIFSSKKEANNQLNTDFHSELRKHKYYGKEHWKLMESKFPQWSS